MAQPHDGSNVLLQCQQTLRRCHGEHPADESKIDTIVAINQIILHGRDFIGTQQLTTSVTIPNQSTIILVGLISETARNSTSGLPVVSRIPYLGNLFKSTKKERNRTELLVFIQPTVVEGNDEIRGASLNEDLRTEIGADAFEAFPPSRNPLAPVPPPTPRPSGR